MFLRICRLVVNTDWVRDYLHVQSSGHKLDAGCVCAGKLSEAAKAMKAQITFRQ